MRRKLLSLGVVLTLCSGPLAAQSFDPFAVNAGAMIHVAQERQNDGCYTGKVYLKAPGSFTVAFYFPMLKNTTHEEHFVKVVRNPGMVFTMRPIDSKQSITFSQSSTWIMMGELNPRNPQKDFIYRLPVSTEKETKVRILRTRPKEGEETSRTGLAFALGKGDTLYAPRKGLVTRVPGEFRLTNTSPTYTSTVIQIEHTDGTYATFSRIGTMDILVEPGDRVFPGTPIAVVKEYIAETFTSASMSIAYRTADIVRSSGVTRSASPFTNVTSVFIDPYFALGSGTAQIEEKGGSYRAVETPEMFTAEMSKKEIQNRDKKK